MKTVKINLIASAELLNAVSCLKAKLGIVSDADGVRIQAFKVGNELNISYCGGGYVIKYSIESEFFRALAICIDKIRRADTSPLIEKRQFETCGVMFDVSRNMVMTVDTVKDYIEYLALMGINMMMLYTEDVYEIEGRPWFGYMRGAYTGDELREIDRYALMFGIELIPCIQTLSHLGTALQWSQARNVKDTNTTLYVGEEETYELIEDMMKSVRECFSSDKIHLGLDEAADVGLGARLGNEGYTHASELMLTHLNRVCELAKKYSFEPMMWSDMFFKFGKIGGDYDYTAKIPENISDMLPSNISLVYWEYVSEKEEVIDMFLKRHLTELKRKTVFAGGVWTWNRMVTNYDKTFETANVQLGACKKNKLSTVIATIWNNTCSMYNSYSTLPCIQMYAEHFYNAKVSKTRLSRMFEICTGYKFKDFMKLGLDDYTADEKKKYMEPDCCCINSASQHFFNDILIGLYDKTLSGFDFKSHYAGYRKALSKITNIGKAELLFRQTEILAGICETKSTIGPEITQAYLMGDKDKLKKLLDDLKNLAEMYTQYHKISRDIWFRQNKPFGWEGCDMLLASIETRIETAIYRIGGFIDGSIKSLPELEAERMYYNGCQNPLTECGSMRKVISACDY